MVFYGQRDEKLFEKAVIFSVLFHGSMWAGFYLKSFFSKPAPDSMIEIDLTKPFRLGGNPLLKPGGGTSLEKPKRIEKPLVPDPIQEKSTIEPAKTAPPKEWILPGPNTKELEKPQLESVPKEKGTVDGEVDGTGEGAPGTGGGWGGGDGQGGGIPLTRFPQLLNRSEILKLLRKFYPDIERQAGREGEVIVDLHLGTEGLVRDVNVVYSAGQSFDRVAQIVAKKMRFSPAMVQKTPVAVKIRQSIVFKLEEDF